MLRIFFLFITFSINVNGSSMYMDSLQSTTGSQISMPVYVNGFTDIISMQGSITFDASVIDYFSVSNFNLPGLSVSSFGTNQTGQGILTYSWYDPSLQGVTVSDSTQLFTIDFNVIGNSGENSNLIFSNNPTTLEMINNNSINQIIILNDGYISIYSTLNIKEKITNISLQPNIAKINQNINIYGLLDGEEFVVYDINGKKNKNYNLKSNKIQFFQKGMFYIKFDKKTIKCLVI